MRWMLDTDTCIYVMKHHPPQVRERLRRVAIGEVGLSAIVLAELRLGVAKSQRRQDNAAALDDFLGYCIVLDWPREAAATYADIRATLEARGTTIGGNDLLIAAHALHLGTTLVTNNTAEFERVAGLTLENWRVL
jgi:tRNA(fMet)-specific endonuclease VapC